MPIDLQPAVKYIKPLKVLLYGPPFSGKTYSAIEMAVGIVMAIRNCTKEEAYKHIIMSDSEFGRGALYRKMGPYNYIKVDPPYDTNKIIKLFDELNLIEDIDVVILDSLTHYWVKEGGILDQKAAKDKEGGNSYTNWQDFTAKFNRMLDSVLSSPKHVIVTARAKTDTVVTMSETGKAVPKSYGLKPELRDGVDYDFDIVFNVDKSTHNLILDKGIPDMELVYGPATEEFGKELFKLSTDDAEIPTKTITEYVENLRHMAKTFNMITFMQLKLSGRKLDDLPIDELKILEAEVIAEVKKQQHKTKK
jgi:hypothetical protein